MSVKLFGNRHQMTIQLIFSFIIGVTTVLTPIIKYDTFLSYLHTENFFVIFRFLIAFVLSFLAVSLLHSFLDSPISIRIIREHSEKQKKEYKFFLLTFFTLLFFWILYFLTFYPGFVTNDGYASIFSPIGCSRQHPIMYNLLVHFLYETGINYLCRFGALVGVATCNLFQIIVVALGVSWCLLYFYNKNINKILLNIFILYFALLPLIGNYVSNVIKDTFFALLMLMMSFLLYECISSDENAFNSRKWWIEFVAVAIGMSWIRNNGIFIIVPTLIILFLVMKSFRKKVGIAFVIILIISILPNMILSVFYHQKHLKKESLAIPLQQIGYVIYENGIEDKEDREFLSQILDLKFWEENYNPIATDNIKWSGKFNDDFFDNNYLHFLGLWVKYLPKNLGSYVKAYLLGTHGFWSIGINNPNQKFYFTYEFFKRQVILPQGINCALTDFYTATTGIYPGAGTCFWLSVLMTLPFILKKKYRYLIIFLPSFLCWCTIMVSTPIAYCFRYVFYYVFCLPFYSLIVLRECSKEY